MMKGLSYQDDITITNIWAPNNRAQKCMKQKVTEMKGEIDSSATTVGDSNTPTSTMDKTRQKINKETEDLSDMTSQKTSLENPT